jgi:TetR/AcrR family transcriptional regulator, regulator of biofilm formation and stress response
MNRRSGPPQRRRGSARKAILAATVEVIAGEGIDAVTHRRVAERAGVSPGSTTHHFASREDLLRSAFRFYLEQADRLLGELDRELRGSVADPVERVVAFLGGVVRREFGDERLVRAEYEMLLFASTDQELASHVRAWEARWVAYIAGDLEAAGTPRAVETARTVLNLVRGYELERLLDPRLETDELHRRLRLLLAPGARGRNDAP